MVSALPASSVAPIVPTSNTKVALSPGRTHSTAMPPTFSSSANAATTDASSPPPRCLLYALIHGSLRGCFQIVSSYLEWRDLVTLELVSRRFAPPPAPRFFRLSENNFYDTMPHPRMLTATEVEAKVLAVCGMRSGASSTFNKSSSVPHAGQSASSIINNATSLAAAGTNSNSRAVNGGVERMIRLSSSYNTTTRTTLASINTDTVKSTPASEHELEAGWKSEIAERVTNASTHVVSGFAASEQAGGLTSAPSGLTSDIDYWADRVYGPNAAFQNQAGNNSKSFNHNAFQQEAVASSSRAAERNQRAVTVNSHNSPHLLHASGIFTELHGSLDSPFNNTNTNVGTQNDTRSSGGNDCDSRDPAVAALRGDTKFSEVLWYDSNNNLNTRVHSYFRETKKTPYI